MRWSGDVVHGNNLLDLPVKLCHDMIPGVSHHPETHMEGGDDTVFEFEGRACARNAAPTIGIHDVDAPTPGRTARTDILGQRWKMMDRCHHCDYQGEGRHGAGAVEVPSVLKMIMILLHERTGGVLEGHQKAR